MLDTPGWSFSWRRLFAPLGSSNVGAILRGAVYQWSLDSFDLGPAKRILYIAADMLFVIGLLRLIFLLRKNDRVRSLLLWSLTGLLAFVVLYGTYWWPFYLRYIQRLVPWLCLVDAVGALTIWDGLTALRRLPRNRPIHLLVGPLRIAFLAAGLLCAAYLIRYLPYDPNSTFPLELYLKCVSQYIPESDALIITNFQIYPADHILVGHTRRTCLPMVWSNAPEWLQWKRPPHPEWIVEDMANRDKFNAFMWGRYRRMYENGAQDIYPDNAVKNPEVIDAALRAGRKVYFVCAGIFQGLDAEACEFLFSRYYVKAIGMGFINSELPATAQYTAHRFLFGQVVAIANSDYRCHEVFNSWSGTNAFAIAKDGRLMPR
jgi:hypothetical protein